MFSVSTDRLRRDASIRLRPIHQRPRLSRALRSALLGAASGVLLSASLACDRRPATPQPLATNANEPPKTAPPKTAPPESPAAAPATPPGSPRNAGSRLGANLTEPRYYTQAWPFVDVMKHADRWFSGRPEHPDPNKRWNDGRKLPLDERGWVRKLEPGQIARTFVFATGTHFHPGRYTVFHKGRGEVDYRGSVSNVSRGPTRDLVTLGPGELWLELQSTDPSDPLREISIVPPGGRCSNDALRYCERDDACGTGASCARFVETFEKEPFHPEFLADIASSKVLRFMDWMETNRPAEFSPEDDVAPPVREVVEWPKRDAASYHPVPLELIVELSNTLKADPWITIPHEASDAFVTAVATLFREKLDPALRVHVEYSNEVWNGMFGQAVYANRKGCERFSKDSRECDEDGDGQLCEPGPWTRSMERCVAYGRRFHAHRTAAVLRIFRTVFGAEARQRVVGVVAWQTGSLMDSGAELLREDVGGERLAQLVDVFAVAPYFGGGIDEMPSAERFFERVSKETFGAPAGTFRILAESPDGKEAGTYFYMASDARRLRENEDFRHLRLVAYEGGQHLFSFASGQGPKIRALNSDPRMKELYLQYLNAFAELTGDSLFVHYSSPGAWWQHGAFGSKEWQGQPVSEAPKHAALEQFARGKSPRTTP